MLRINGPSVFTDLFVISQGLGRLDRASMTIPADGFQIIGIVEQGHITLVRLLVVDDG